MRGTANITFNGISRELRCDLGMGLAIEDATGKGVIELAQELASGRTSIRTVCRVMQAALAHAGQRYSEAEILAAVEADGLTKTIPTALQICLSCFAMPEEAKKAKPGKGGTSKKS